jgi:hypothetical protein
MASYKKFTPFASPVEMLILGVFGGNYLSREDIMECDPDWLDVWEQKRSHLVGAKGQIVRDVSKNCFNSDAGLTREWWIKTNLIRDCDPKGWFQWYCRFYVGRRCTDDKRQIDRWCAYTRHSNRLSNLLAYNPDKFVLSNDLRRDFCYPRARQSLLQWSLNPFPELSAEKSRLFLGLESHDPKLYFG